MLIKSITIILIRFTYKGSPNNSWGFKKIGYELFMGHNKGITVKSDAFNLPNLVLFYLWNFSFSLFNKMIFLFNEYMSLFLNLKKF